MPTLLFKEVGLVKGVKFNSWRRIGGALQAVKVYNMREVDELIFLDIGATRAVRGPDFSTVDEFADECFMPLTVGGGVRNVEDVKGLLRVGADKVSINTAAIENPDLIEQAASRFGSQCVVVSIDVRVNDGRHQVYTRSGTCATELDPVAVAIRAEALGAGEILLTSIDRDGTMEGYDTAVIRRIADAVSIPVIASGGAGSYEHMLQAIREGGASAVAAASIFHFTQHTPLEAKRYLRSQGLAVRLPSN